MILDGFYEYVFRGFEVMSSTLWVELMCIIPNEISNQLL